MGKTILFRDVVPKGFNFQASSSGQIVLTDPIEALTESFFGADGTGTLGVAMRGSLDESEFGLANLTLKINVEKIDPDAKITVLKLRNSGGHHNFKVNSNTKYSGPLAAFDDDYADVQVTTTLSGWNPNDNDYDIEFRLRGPVTSIEIGGDELILVSISTYTSASSTVEINGVSLPVEEIESGFFEDHPVESQAANQLLEIIGSTIENDPFYAPLRDPILSEFKYLLSHDEEQLEQMANAASHFGKPQNGGGGDQVGGGGVGRPSLPNSPFSQALNLFDFIRDAFGNIVAKLKENTELILCVIGFIAISYLIQKLLAPAAAIAVADGFSMFEMASSFYEKVGHAGLKGIDQLTGYSLTETQTANLFLVLGIAVTAFSAIQECQKDPHNAWLQPLKSMFILQQFVQLVEYAVTESK